MPALTFRKPSHTVVPVRLRCAIIAVALAAMPSIALCASFICKPPGAGTIIRDSPPKECSTVDIREINPDGTVKRIIRAPLTEEQKKATVAKEERQAACAERNREWSRETDALLTRYRSADDIEADRDRELAKQQGLIEWFERGLHELQSNRFRLALQEEFHPSGQIWEELRRDVESNLSLRSRALSAIEKARDEMNAIDARYDATVSRYSEIVAGTAKPPFQCEE